MFGKKTERRLAPSGLVTTMFTDIVGSTALKGMMPGETSARRDAAFLADIKEPHDAIVLACVQDAGGYVINSTGDGYCVSFVDVEEAVLCALQIQKRLRQQPVPTPHGNLQVRIGLHTGMAEATSGDYTAATMDKAARVQGQAEGGEVVVSRETHALVAGKLQGITFEQAGTFDLKGLDAEGLYRVALISAVASGQNNHDSEGTSRQQMPPNPRKRKSRAAFWPVAALAVVLLGVSAYFLLTRGVLRPAPVLPTGSVWAGSFRFLPPMQSYAGSANLTVMQRTGNQFQGIYATEGDKYKWRVDGTVQGSHLRWEFTQAIKNSGSEDAVGKAYVDGTVTGDQITGRFHEYNSPSETAALQMHRGN